MGLIQSSGCFVDQWSGWGKKPGKGSKSALSGQGHVTKAAVDKQIWN